MHIVLVRSSLYSTQTCYHVLDSESTARRRVDRGTWNEQKYSFRTMMTECCCSRHVGITMRRTALQISIMDARREGAPLPMGVTMDL